MGASNLCSWRGGHQDSKFLAPPELVSPLNLQPIIVADPKTAPMHFAWKPAATARSYEVRISNNPMFSHA